jgi:hypothetical protein
MSMYRIEVVMNIDTPFYGSYLSSDILYIRYGTWGRKSIVAS